MSSNVPDRSLDLLAGRVFDIPEPQFVDLVRSLKARRLKTDQRATADAVLSRLRPRMSLARPPRRSTPQRLFCMPFEDLLYDPGTPRKAIGRIPRSAILPIWSLIAKHANPSVLEATSAILKSAEPNDRQAWYKAGTALWAEAARVLSERDAEARKTPTGRARLRDALGGEPILSSLDDIYALTSVATTILELRSALPPAPIETIDLEVTGRPGARPARRCGPQQGRHPARHIRADGPTARPQHPGRAVREADRSRGRRPRSAGQRAGWRSGGQPGRGPDAGRTCRLAGRGPAKGGRCPGTGQRSTRWNAPRLLSAADAHTDGGLSG